MNKVYQELYCVRYADGREGRDYKSMSGLSGQLRRSVSDGRIIKKVLVVDCEYDLGSVNEYLDKKEAKVQKARLASKRYQAERDLARAKKQLRELGVLDD